MNYKVKRRMFALLCLVVIMASLSCTAFAATYYEVKTNSGIGANLRESPSTASAIVASLSDGTKVYRPKTTSTYADNYTWYYVIVTSGYYSGEYGYIVADYLSYIS